jgi:hypothetical protein
MGCRSPPGPSSAIGPLAFPMAVLLALIVDIGSESWCSVAKLLNKPRAQNTMGWPQGPQEALCPEWRGAGKGGIPGIINRLTDGRRVTKSL